ncbi:MAG: hypothetical protein JW395_2394 [Nitrospira sp.]|nr:hypothetical protein [Nitrospira sp.]
MIIVDTTVWVDYLRGTGTPHTGGVKRYGNSFLSYFRRQWCRTRLC